MSTDADSIRSTVTAYCEAFTKGDRDAYVNLFAPDAWIEDPVGTPKREGREAIGAFFDESRSLAATIELRQTGPVRVAAGEAAFPMQARPELDGTTFKVDIIDVMTFDDAGLITTMRAFWDPAEMAPASD